MIISHVKSFMVISNVTIIADSALCFKCYVGGNFCGNRAIFLYNKQNNILMPGNMKFILSWSTLEINFIFPRIHVLFSIYNADVPIVCSNSI